MSECRESIVIRKIVPIVPHDNNACASLSREKSIYPRNSLFHGKPNALCTGLSDALGTFPASRVCRENEHPRKKAGALLLQRRPLRVHSSTIRMLQICHHDQGRRASHANMVRLSPRRGARNGTHAEKNFECLYLNAFRKGAGYPAVARCNADIRMPAVLVEFVSATTCIATTKSSHRNSCSRVVDSG